MEENKKIPATKGLGYLALALPFLFGAPIVVTIGFKALSKDGIYWILIVGIILALVAMIIMALGVKYLVQYFFQSDS